MCCTCKVAFLLIRSIVVFHRFPALPSPLKADRHEGFCSRRGGSRIFFRRGCTLLLLYFNTNKPHSFFLQNTSCIRKPQVISGGRGGAHPLHPPPRSAPVPEHAPGSFCTANTEGVIVQELASCHGTHVETNERNLVWDSWYSPDECLGTSSKLNLATSLRSRSKEEKLILLMMMILEDHSSVCKKCQENLGSPVVSEKTGERGFLYYSRTVRGKFRHFVNTWECHTQTSRSSTSEL